MAFGLLITARASAGEPVPVLAQSMTGRFEVSAVDPSLGHAVAAQAEEAWRQLAIPLVLPDRFGTPVYFRIAAAVAPAAANEVPFDVAVETGGLVSVVLRGEAATTPNVRRALVRGLLMRQAVAQNGVTSRLRVPRWLEEGAVGWWQSRADAAQVDAWQQQSRGSAPPALSDLLAWQHGPSSSPGFSLAAVWLFSFLQVESRRGGEWPALLRALLAGDDPDVALALHFPDRFRTEAERELWWQTGWYQMARARTLPTLEAADSRVQLSALARFVFADPSGANDVVLPLREVVSRLDDPIVGGEVTRRVPELNRLVAVLHPFYRNAGLALAEVFAAHSARPERREKLRAAFEQDWQDAIKLEAATTAALDALEAQGRGR